MGLCMTGIECTRCCRSISIQCDGEMEDLDGVVSAGFCLSCIDAIGRAMEAGEDLMRTYCDGIEGIMKSSEGPPLPRQWDEKGMLMRECLQLQVELRCLLDERKCIEGDLLRLKKAENELLRDALRHRETITDHCDERSRMDSIQRRASNELARLETVNVINDTFHIWQDGKIPTINGFRLGRLPPYMNVSWDEINVALGQKAPHISIVIHPPAQRIELCCGQK
eukprot:GHVO01005949.1.p1 GENE.GHVO01005949.1~~GHVO01005949.1.p1  ORF type:complete len:224 (+),score=32.93 GHVO01005949.1:2-673(+)